MASAFADVAMSRCNGTDRPWRNALPLDFNRPAAVLGPVLFCALARLAAIYFSVATEALLLLGGFVGIVTLTPGVFPMQRIAMARRPRRAVEIESRLKRFGFDPIALNAEVYVQARDQLEIFDNLQRAQQRRMVLLREISIRREFAKRMKRVSDRVIEGRVSLARQAVPKEPDVGVTSASSNR
jgi:hypothetical protein